MQVPCTAVSESVVTNHVLEYNAQFIKPTVRDVILPERSATEFNTLVLIELHLNGHMHIYSRKGMHASFC